ncbi:MAG: YceI family protein [Saprospiraceae bacterium]|nr:YceI family protein [Lewinella sp.]
MKLNKAMKHWTLRISCLAIATFAFSALGAQSFKLSPDKPYEVYVSGGSTLHDWTATVNNVIDIPPTMTINLKEGGVIESFGFKAEGKSMEGGRGSTMDNKIYKAVKCDVHPYITYKQTAPAKLQAAGKDQFKLISKGIVSVAGMDKEIEVEVMASLKDGVLTFTGEEPMKLSDFEIDPPSALFGQIQTKDDITVHFTINYQAE